MIIVLFGPPGSGKGTQAQRVAARADVPHVATGDMLRAEVAKGSALGREAEPIMQSGKLVSDDLIVRIIESRLSEPDATNGALLDGFPRTVPQSQALDSMLQRRGRGVDIVVALQVRDDELRRRVLQRAEIEGRADDTAEAFDQRLRIYREETEPVLGHYRRLGTRVAEIDGVGEIDDVTERISAALTTDGALA
ncbi:MAG: adenylate kinase [Candidatus Dormibacteraeota bacterium]|nr:adenylate kinase [Candidatus Dormibacteraeota bacterium]